MEYGTFESSKREKKRFTAKVKECRVSLPGLIKTCGFLKFATKFSIPIQCISEYNDVVEYQGLRWITGYESQ